MPIVLEKAHARAEVIPERGALVSRFSVGGEDILFLDPATLSDPTKSLRGGIPVLFPMAGQLPENRYQVDGRDYEMGRHGFARHRPWSVVERGANGLSMELASDADTLAQFPWKFRCTFEVALDPHRLRLTWTTRNLDSRPLPLHVGFHPYFFVPDKVKAAARVETTATRAFNNQTGEQGPFTGLPLTDPEVDLHLLDHSEPGTVLHRGPDLKPVKLGWSSEFTTLVVWTLGGRDFVCVEPWTALGGALARGEGLLDVPPGEARTLRFTIEV